MLSKKLYVLCVGVNEYKASTVSNLGGCVNDANHILNYFTGTSQNTDFEIDGKILVNEEATKANIVEHFQTHLGQAKKGDVAVFYFSGHGAEESADEVFEAYSHTDSFTTLVCHDSRVDASDLADKELRYLINQISGQEDHPHFVLITDSCHSGGATRSMDDLKPRLTKKTDTRKWSDFIFADQISRKDVEKAVSLKDVFPEGEHVHLSSCEDGELAYEVGGSGVFTSALLDILKQSSGQVSYQDINSRTRLMLGGRFPQKPTIYATQTDGYNELFLGGSIENKGITAPVKYNTTSNKWIFGLGTVHGINDHPSHATEVELFDIQNNFIGTATVDKAAGPYSDVLISPETLQQNLIHKDTIYNGLVKNIFRPAVNFYITGEEEGVQKLEDFFVNNENKAAELKRKNFILVDNELNAHYVIRAKNNEFLITYPFDHRPLVRQLSYNGKNTFKTLDVVYLPQIAIWEYLHNLYNEKSQLRPRPPVEIKLYKVVDKSNPSKDELLVPINGEIVIEEGEEIKIQVFNNHRRKKLYYTLFYMERTFGVEIYSDKGAYLNPRKDYWVAEKQAIEVYLEPEENPRKRIFEYVKKFNFEDSFFVLKLVACTEQLNGLLEFKQDALPSPIYPALDANLQDRPIAPRKSPEVPDWATHSITVRIPNRDFDKNR